MLIDFSDYFIAGKDVHMRLFICRKGHYGGHRRTVELKTNIHKATVESSSTSNVVLTVKKSNTSLYTDDQNIGWIDNRGWANSNVTHSNGSIDAVQMQWSDIQCPP